MPAQSTFRITELYLLVYRKRSDGYTSEADLDAIDTAIDDFDASFQKTIAPFMASRGKTIKYHKLSHITDTIRNFGSLAAVSAQAFEHAHVFVKHMYRKSNRQLHNSSFLTQMIQHMHTERMAKQVPAKDYGVHRKVYR